MRTIDEWLTLYGRDHQNPTNKIIHWICVPVIVFTVFGLLMSVPFPDVANGWINVATIVFVFALIFYFRLSLPIFLGMLVIGSLMFIGNRYLATTILPNIGLTLWQLSLLVFVLAWILQFIGHKIEGQKPSFLEDMQFLLIGPIWLLHFVFNKVGIPYK
ncbi:MAG: Mpo1-like protein [Chitinophagales bacterium]